MNWDQIERNWKQLAGKFIDDELDALHGRREQFVGKLQEKNGFKHQEAENELDDHLSKW